MILIITSPGQNYVFFDWLSAVDLSAANGTYCIGLVVNDGLFNQIATSTKTLTIDNVNPATPGNLTLNNKTDDSITLNFGSQSSDTHFAYYKIFYKIGTSGVAESDTAHIDSHLNSVTYGGATTTTITGLISNTNYVINIWAYDTYGNKATATEVSVMTNAGPTNISADNQFKSNGFTSIANNSWTDESSVIFSASAHDKNATDTNGTTSLPFELESFNGATGDLVAWVKTDISSTPDMVLYMYYGNAENTTDYSDATNVWDTNFAGVWHLNETVVDESSLSNAHIDSAINNNGDQTGNNEITGKIGKAQEFDGNDYINIGDDNSLDVTDAVTIEFWINKTGTVQSQSSSTVYTVTGSQTFSVPFGLSSLTAKAWGAGGGGGGGGSAGFGGNGAGSGFAGGTFSVFSGESLSVHIGGGGGGGRASLGGTSGSGGGGGGRTGIARGTSPLIVAAAGGGGGGGDNSI